MRFVVYIAVSPSGSKKEGQSTVSPVAPQQGRVYQENPKRSSDSRLGIVDGEVVIDVTDIVGTGGQGPGGPLAALLEQGYDPALFTPERISKQPRRELAQVKPLAPLPRPGKVIGAPVNYLEHKAEMAVTQTIADLGIFLKATSSVVGPGGPVRLPYLNKRTDQEAELAVVIGRTARNVAASAALDYVFGYTCALDITVRSSEDRSTRKSFDTFTPLGPWVVTADEIADPHNLALRCWVNGQLRQQGNTRDLIFDVANLVAYTSSVMTLWPGDVILTGTPAGVGPIVDGDQVLVEIEKIGQLAVTVSAEDALSYDARPGPRHIHSQR